MSLETSDRLLPQSIDGVVKCIKLGWSHPHGGRTCQLQKPGCNLQVNHIHEHAISYFLTRAIIVEATFQAINTVYRLVKDCSENRDVLSKTKQSACNGTML